MPRNPFEWTANPAQPAGVSEVTIARAGAPVPRPRRSAARVLVAAVAAFATATAGAEVALRLFVGEPHRYADDPERGRIPLPGSAHWQGAEGRATAHYDALGLHDPGVRATKPAGERRVLVLGDSLTEALEVGDDDNFCRLLERRLAGAKVVNAGRMAYLAGEMVHTAEVLQPGVRADAAVLVVRPSTFGDDGDPRVALPGYWAARYDFSPDGEGRLVRLDGAGATLKRFPRLAALKQRSAVVDLGVGEAARRLLVTAPTPPPDLALYRRRVDFALRRLARLYGGRVALVLLPHERLIAGDSDGSDDREAVLRAAAAAAGVPFLSMREPFRAIYRDERRLPFGFDNVSPPDVGHLNVRGHRAVADALAPIVGRLLP